jgi:endonuclease/exonuclease/phosphatase family metal-dependent hydrolase
VPRSFHAYCPKAALDWSYRYPLILDTIKSINPDILALQEVNLAGKGSARCLSPKSAAQWLTHSEVILQVEDAIFLNQFSEDLQDYKVIFFPQVHRSIAIGEPCPFN